MSKVCTNCGTVLRADSKFCVSCGTEVSREYTDHGMNLGISAEGFFDSTRDGLSNLFVYSKIGRGFTGDLSFVRDSVSRNMGSIDKDMLVSIADSKIGSVRQVFSKITNEMSDDNWANVLFMLRNGIPTTVTAYFFDSSLLNEVRMILDRMNEISKLRWEKTGFLGKPAVPTANFEDVFTLRYLMNNIRF